MANVWQTGNMGYHLHWQFAQKYTTNQNCHIQSFKIDWIICIRKAMAF